MLKLKSNFVEQAVTDILDDLNIPYRVQAGDLPGTPDIVLLDRNAVVFVHGCIWHGHACRKRPVQWREKIARNIARDLRAKAELEALGWEVIVVWECERTHIRDLKNRLSARC